MSNPLRPFFLLRPDVAFLNHGSFGACPRPVFEEYGRWQRELELQPVEFFARRGPGLLRESRAVLGEYLHADPDDLVYIPNATTGANIVARSLKLKKGEEVLGTDHEYGACDRMWRFLAAREGFSYRRAVMPVPVTTHAEFVEQFFAQVSDATRVIFISHITSPTALTFPVAEICRRARARGIITIVDGAHVPGQIPLDLTALDADFYMGNLHKWICSPKGSAFLYARRSVQGMIEPLVVSWGWEAYASSGSTFIDYLQVVGTDDIAAPLSVPAAIAFQREHDWDTVRRQCHQMVRRARAEMIAALDAEPISPDTDEWYMQMCALRLPAGIDGHALQSRLYQEHLVEIPVFDWNEGEMIRVSIQGYNTWDDVERLLEGIRAIRASM